jgi:hypothetical protein
MNEGINHYWPTPILKDTIADRKLLENITNYTLIKYGENNKILSSDTDKNLLDDPYYNEFKNKIVIPCFNKFLKQNLNIDLNTCVYKLKSWLTGYGINYAMSKHNHAGSQLSAVFYLLAEEKTSGGSLIIQDPRFNANRGYESEKFGKWFECLKFTPKTGDVLIFPSFVYHSVDVYYGKLRLAMPVDLFLYNDD